MKKLFTGDHAIEAAEGTSLLPDPGRGPALRFAGMTDESHSF